MGEIVTQDVCGFLGSTPVYRLSVHVDVFQRLVELAREGLDGLPDWLDLGQSTVRDRRVILTGDPDWFRVYFKEGVS